MGYNIILDAMGPEKHTQYMVERMTDIVLPPRPNSILFYRKNVIFARGKIKFVGLNNGGEKNEKGIVNLVFYSRPTVSKMRRTSSARRDQAASSPYLRRRSATQERSSASARSHSSVKDCWV